MWNNCVVWSEGDLSSRHAEYCQFIKVEYSGSYEGRVKDVEEMIKRLQAERSMLKNIVPSSKFRL